MVEETHANYFNPESRDSRLEKIANEARETTVMKDFNLV